MLKYTVKISGTGTGDLTSPLTIESGRPVYINGFILSTGTASNISLLSGDGTVTYAVISMGVNTTLVYHAEFYAAAGFRISSSQADNTAIVFHSQAGA